VGENNVHPQQTLDEASYSGSKNIFTESGCHMKTAVAVFVKTPGFSPIKTRLAQVIGYSAAESFFIQCVQTIEKTLLEVKELSNDKLKPFWAVGEKDGISNLLWKNFKTIYTEKGSLGERQHWVYSSLKRDYDSVILIGADSPQQSVSGIFKAVKALNSENDFILGPALDGGYYLLGGKGEIPLKVWMGIPYSAKNTYSMMLNALKARGTVQELNALVDVDTADDLNQLIIDLNASEIQQHRKLAGWITSQIWFTKVHDETVSDQFKYGNI